MTELLSTYEKDYRKNNDKINNNFDKILLEPNQITGAESHQKISKTNLLEETDKLIESQKKLLKQMEIEISYLTNNSNYGELNSKLNSYKKTLDLNKKKLNELYAKEDSKNNSSFLSESNLLSENNRILMNKERYMYNRSEKLMEARRTLSATEEMGSHIIMDMDNQTQNMKNVAGKLKKMGKNLVESNKILNTMKSRSKKNKRIIILLSVLFFLVIISILSLKLYRKNKTK